MTLRDLPRLAMLALMSASLVYLIIAASAAATHLEIG